MRTVLFDIGNVFVRWSPAVLYEKLIPDAVERAYFLEHVVTLDWHTEHDRGRPFAESVAERSAEFPKYAELIAAFDARFLDTISGEIKGSIALLEALVQHGVACFALTNFSAEKYYPFAAAYPFTRHFSGVVVSGEEGLVKPDPEIFRRTIDRFDLDAERTLFVDDRAENVEAATALGFGGHIFTDAQRLEADLINAGLLPGTVL